MSERLSSAPRGRARQGASLAERRLRRRRRFAIALSVLFALLLSAAVYGLWQSPVRVSRVDVYGLDASLAAYAREALQGAYLGIIPRDSIFFFPESRIRASILADHPDIAAVSISRESFSVISIRPHQRVPLARWCGLAPTGGGVEEYCYVFDASGYVFAAADASAPPLNSFTLYAPLEGGAQEPPAVSEVEPLRATIARIERIPALFDFARELGTRGSAVSHIVLRGDEVDDYLESGTRITYVLGREQEAFTALVSARDSLDLSDGSLDYVDLRFDGKVYIKRKE